MQASDGALIFEGKHRCLDLISTIHPEPAETPCCLLVLASVMIK